MKTKYYIISTLIALFCLLMLLSVSGCRAHNTTNGTMVELPKTPTDSVKGGGR